MEEIKAAVRTHSEILYFSTQLKDFTFVSRLGFHGYALLHPLFTCRAGLKLNTVTKSTTPVGHLQRRSCNDTHEIFFPHMGLFDFLASLTPAVTIPTFVQGADRDSTNLQIRSLLYLFKRLRINKLALFPSGDGLKYTDGKHWDDLLSGTDLTIAKLDSMYNLAQFEQLLVADAQRVLIDYPKNKFRMFCVLSEYPSADFSRPLSPVKGASTADEFQDGFPVLKDYKERKIPHFYFSIIPVDTSVPFRELAADLANSLLYVEHNSYVTFAARFHVASKAISYVLGNTASEDAMIFLSEDSKAAILSRYLNELAFHVQLIRIYDQHIKQIESLPVRSQSPTKLRSVKSFSHLPPSPTKIGAPSSPNHRQLSPKRSLANLRAPQLTSRPSISNFNANEIYNPVAAPPSPEKSRKPISNIGVLSGTNLSDTLIYGKEIRPEIWEKCKHSIREKLARAAVKV